MICTESEVLSLCDRSTNSTGVPPTRLPPFRGRQCGRQSIVQYGKLHRGPEGLAPVPSRELREPPYPSAWSSCQTFGALPGQKTGLMTRVRTNVIHHFFMDQYSVYNCVCIYLLYIHILVHVCLKKCMLKKISNCVY